MGIEALLLTRDFHLQRTVERTLDAFAIGVEHHTNGQMALQRVAEWKFSAVIADCEHDEGLALLEATRLEPRNKNGIAIAAVRAGLGVRLPFRSGANFVLEKPITRKRVDRLVRAAYGLIAREHFRYLRHALDVPVRTLFPKDVSPAAQRVLDKWLAARSEFLTAGSLRPTLPPRADTTSAGYANAIYPGAMRSVAGGD